MHAKKYHKGYKNGNKYYYICASKFMYTILDEDLRSVVFFITITLKYFLNSGSCT